MKHAAYLIVLSALLLMACSDDVPLEPLSSSIKSDAPAEAPRAVTRPFFGYWETRPIPGPINPEFDCDGDPSTVPELAIEGIGFSTHGGRDTFVGDSEFPGPGLQCGHSVSTVANGDTYEIDIFGTSTPPDAQGNIFLEGDWQITGGTGRFEGATGGGTYEGVFNVVTLTGQVSNMGTITY